LDELKTNIQYICVALGLETCGSKWQIIGIFFIEQGPKLDTLYYLLKRLALFPNDVDDIKYEF